MTSLNQLNDGYGSDPFFASVLAPPPNLTEMDAISIFEQHWMVARKSQLLTAERDQNFLITAVNGSEYILKFSNPDERANVTNLQTSTLRFLEANARELPVPRLVLDRTGEPEVQINLSDGRRSIARVFSKLSGNPLNRDTLQLSTAYAMGRTLAKLNRALEDFKHPAEKHDLIWDVRGLGRLHRFLPYIRSVETRERVETTINSFVQNTLPVLSELPHQLVHNDLNPSNVFLDGERITGMIDFGDMVKAPRVFDPAIGACYLIAPTSSEPLEAASEFLRGYCAISPLLEEELAVVKDVIQARFSLTLLITSWRASLFPQNREYILRNAKQAEHALNLVGRGLLDSLT